MIRMHWSKDKWLLTPQAEHSRLAGIIAASWDFAGDRPNEEVFYAVMHCQDGWKTSDLLPAVNAAAAPANFDEIDFKTRFSLWYDSVSHCITEKKYYGTLILCSYYEKQIHQIDLAKVSVECAKEMGRYISRLRRSAAVALSEAEKNNTLINEETLEKDCNFLSVCHDLSMILCSEAHGSGLLENVPYINKELSQIKYFKKPGQLSATLTPLPFKKNLRDHLTSWIVPNQEYTEETLKDFFNSTKMVTNEVHFGIGNSE